MKSAAGEHTGTEASQSTSNQNQTALLGLGRQSCKPSLPRSPRQVSFRERRVCHVCPTHIRGTLGCLGPLGSMKMADGFGRAT